MIVSENPVRANSRLLRAFVLLCAVLVLPLGLVVAQDYDAVAERLEQAVDEGELSREQAKAMLGALKETVEGDDEADVGGEIGEYLEAVGDKLKAAVEAGKLSEEDAWAKWHSIKEEKIGLRPARW